MRERYVEDLANHDGSESCVGGRKAVGDALTGAQAGRVSSLEKFTVRGADAVRRSGRPHPARRYRETRWDPARSETPSTYGNTSHENREIPWSPVAAVAPGRVGKSIDARRR